MGQTASGLSSQDDKNITRPNNQVAIRQTSGTNVPSPKFTRTIFFDERPVMSLSEDNELRVNDDVLEDIVSKTRLREDLFTPSATIDDIADIVRQHINTLFLDGSNVADQMVNVFVQYSPQVMTPQNVIKRHYIELTPYERLEIAQYRHIYFFGLNAEKRPGRIGSHFNSLYDDFNRFYRHILHDHIAYRYETLNSLGRGGFGEVVRAFDHKRNGFVAIKIIKNKPTYTVKAEREIRLMQYLRKKDNESTYVVELKNAFVFRHHPCLVLELMYENLLQIIKLNGKDGLTLFLTRKLAKSILRALKFLAQNCVIHGDIKPENILGYPGNTRLKLSDFGLSTLVKDGRPINKRILQTRWYRAPEVLLGCPYTSAIDLWSFGCVVAEMITGKPLFEGEDEKDQLARIVEVLGMPPVALVLESTRLKVFFRTSAVSNSPNVTTQTLISSSSFKRKLLKRPGSKSLSSIIGTENEDLLDFLKKCLAWDPVERITAEEALSHKWILTKIPEPVPSELFDLEDRFPPINTITLRSSFQRLPYKQHSRNASLSELILCRSEQLRLPTSEELNTPPTTTSSESSVYEDSVASI